MADRFPGKIHIGGTHRVADRDQQAFGNAVEVVRAGVKLLEEYGEQDEWMGEIPA